MVTHTCYPNTQVVGGFLGVQNQTALKNKQKSHSIIERVSKDTPKYHDYIDDPRSWGHCICSHCFLSVGSRPTSEPPGNVLEMQLSAVGRSTQS